MSTFFSGPRPAAVLKHGILSRYLQPFVQKVGSTSGRVCYLDGYSGPGKYEDGTPGSPALAAETANIVKSVERVEGYFVERDAASYTALKDIVTSSGASGHAYHGDVATHLPTVVAAVGAAPLFAFLDPFGLGLPLDLLQTGLLDRAGRLGRFGRTGGSATEVLLNFSLPGLRRNAGHLTSTSTDPSYAKARSTIVSQVDAALGGTWWQPIWRSGDADREQQILDGYVHRLTELEGGWNVWRVRVANRWNGPAVYHLLLLTQHPDGLWLFNQSVSGAMEEYRTACYAQSGEFDFEPLAEREAAWIRELARNLEGLLGEGKPVTIGKNMAAVYGDLLGYAREKHVRAAVKSLYAEGKTSTNGKGDVQHLVVTPLLGTVSQAMSA